MKQKDLMSHHEIFTLDNSADDGEKTTRENKHVI